MPATRPEQVFTDGICDACGGELVARKDDNEVAIMKRLGEYHKQTEPVSDFLKEKGLPIITVNGDNTVEAINKELCEKLGL